MLASARSAAVSGIDAFEVTVEVHAALGLPQLTVVGLAAGAVKEGRERVVAALANSGLPLPPRRTTVNLSPADVPKSGAGFDLPIALGALAATDLLPPDALTGLVALGELALDGTLRPVRGVLPVARWAADRGHTLVVPPANLAEAARISGLRVHAPATLRDLVDALAAGPLPHTEPPRPSPTPRPTADDFADVVGQETAKRALEIAAAGGHNLDPLCTSQPPSPLSRMLSPAPARRDCIGVRPRPARRGVRPPAPPAHPLRLGPTRATSGGPRGARPRLGTPTHGPANILPGFVAGPA